MSENLKIEIPYNKFKIFLGFIFFLGVIIFLSWSFLPPITKLHPQYSPSLFQTGLGIVGILFCGLCCFFALKAIISKKPALVIDDKGIMVRDNFIPWRDISRIETITRQYSRTSAKYIVIFLTNPEQFIQNQNNRLKQLMLILTRKNLGSPTACSTNTLKCNLDDLKNILASKFAIYGNYAQSPQKKPSSATLNKNYDEAQSEHVINKNDSNYRKRAYLGTIFAGLALIFYVILSIGNVDSNLFFSWLTGPHHNLDMVIILILSILCFAIYFRSASPKSPTLKRNTLFKTAFIIIFAGYFAAINITSLAMNSKDEVPEWEKEIALYTLETKANFGIASAQNDLGVIYLEGKIAKIDKVKAKYWLEKAAAQNDQKAIHNLKLLG